MRASCKSWFVRVPQFARRELSSGRSSAATQHSVADATLETQSKPPLSRVRGTRDFHPSDLRLRHWLFNHWRSVALLHGFEQYDAPILEHEELYVRKSGPEIVSQLYSFEDQSGRRLALRPEMTPSLARVVAANRSSTALPLKWWSVPQCWRYERMSRGRRREHYQWNMDIWGVAGATAEAELLSAIIQLFSRVGLTSRDVHARLSCRRYFAAALTALGLPPAALVPTAQAIDALHKRGVPATAATLSAAYAELELGLGGPDLPPAMAGQQDRALELADAVVHIAQLRGPASRATLCQFEGEIRRCAAAVGSAQCDVQDDLELALSSLGDVVDLASASGHAEWIELDTSIVRGLQYYTGTVFEAFDCAGELRAICGGGRYDKLLSAVAGGEDVCAAGFGFGDAVLLELLEAKRLLPSPDELCSATAPDVVLYTWGEAPELRSAACSLATRLRTRSLAVDLILDARRAKWAFKLARRRCATHTVMVAPDEWARGSVVVKHMETGKQTDVAIDDIVDFLQR